MESADGRLKVPAVLELCAGGFRDVLPELHVLGGGIVGDVPGNSPRDKLRAGGAISQVRLYPRDQRRRERTIESAVLFRFPQLWDSYQTAQQHHP